MIALLINSLFAVFWLFFSKQPNVLSFLLGYLIGFALIAAVSQGIGGQAYVRRTLGLVCFLLSFLWQFIQANLEVARLVLFVPKRQLKAGFVEYSVKEMTFGEALLLSHCITLTPGTITAVFDWKHKILCIHVLDFSDPALIEKRVNQKLKQAIWRFSR